jgi:tetratricopeptide (TPR) repeat protein
LTGEGGSVNPLSVAKALTKELKKPDEFVSFWTKFGRKLAEHRKKVITLSVLAAVAFAAGWGAIAFRESEAAKATVAFARIERIASASLLPEKPDAKDPAAKVESDGLPHFKTEKERLEAAIKEADAFVAAFGREGLGRKALLGKASRLLALGQYAEAASLYETLAASETDAELRAVEQEGIAAAAEARGQLDEALREYTALVDLSQQTNGNFYLDRALFAKARVLERLGKGKEAEPVLREILSKVPKTPLRQQIDDRLALLAEK